MKVKGVVSLVIFTAVCGWAATKKTTEKPAVPSALVLQNKKADGFRNKKGDVFRLPQTMTGDFAVPEAMGK